MSINFGSTFIVIDNSPTTGGRKNTLPQIKETIDDYGSAVFYPTNRDDVCVIGTADPSFADSTVTFRLTQLPSSHNFRIFHQPETELDVKQSERHHLNVVSQINDGSLDPLLETLLATNVVSH
ncbi:MAG: hypothetical protein VKJ04_07570 [Vampirovibrionales bacterium]|nr:hypothetical protein [Vampirovibrionales bacterium]